MKLLSIVMPVYNEAGTLAEIVQRVLSADLPAALERELILVDDGSTDGCWPLIERLVERHAGSRLVPLRQERNRGKGAALRRGFAEARGDVVIIQDADLEYDPADYAAVLGPILDGRADVVYGSRFAGGAGGDAAVHYLGNRVLTWVSNLMTGLRLTDMETCYKAFRREVLARITIRSERFEVEPELTAKSARLVGRGRIVEVPIRYAGRDYSAGKKITWVDGLKAIWTILRYRFAD
jgi:glycosyltransferase involved in cell wall biosynthesis